MNLQEQSEQERIIENTKELNERIDFLEKKLHNALNHTYVGDTDDLYVMNGELHITYYDGQRTLTIDSESLFKDLPFIINQVCKEQKKMNKMYLKQIKKALK